MRHYCRDTELGRLPLGFSCCRERLGPGSEPGGKVTCVPSLPPCPHINPLHTRSFLVPLPMGTQPRDVLLDVGPPLQGVDVGPGTHGRLLGSKLVRRLQPGVCWGNPVALALWIYLYSGVRSRTVPGSWLHGKCMGARDWKLQNGN